MSKTYTGTYMVTSQADADALVGTSVTGNVELTSAASSVTVHDFTATAPSGLGTASADHLILLDLVGGPSNVTAHNFKLDGNQQIAAQGIGGDTYATNVSLTAGEVTGTGDDGSKAFAGTTYTNMYIHDLRAWNNSTDGTWNVNNNDTAQPHQDGIQAQRGNTVIYQSWIESSNSPTATSSLLAIPDVGVNMTVTATYSYFSGSAVQSIQAFNQDRTLAGGTNGMPGLVTNFDFENNLISPNYGSYPGSPYSINLYTCYVTISNVLTSDTRAAVAPPSLTACPALPNPPSSSEAFNETF